MVDSSFHTMADGDPPETPPSGYIRLYPKSGKMYFKDANGKEWLVTANTTTTTTTTTTSTTTTAA